MHNAAYSKKYKSRSHHFEFGCLSSVYTKWIQRDDFSIHFCQMSCVTSAAASKRWSSNKRAKPVNMDRNKNINWAINSTCVLECWCYPIGKLDIARRGINLRFGEIECPLCGSASSSWMQHLSCVLCLSSIMRNVTSNIKMEDFHFIIAKKFKMN